MNSYSFIWRPCDEDIFSAHQSRYYYTPIRGLRVRRYTYLRPGNEYWGLACVPLGSVFTAKDRNQMPRGDEGHVYILVAPSSHNADPAREIPQRRRTSLASDRQRYYLRDMLE